MSRASDAGGASPRDTLLRAIREAAEIAMRYFRADPKSWKKDDVSPVSEADLAVDAHLRATLLAPHPGYGWLSEESEDDPARLGAERVWVVDPIDGTRAFLDGKEEFSISVALVEGAAPLLGAVMLPAAQTLYLAERGRGASRDGAALELEPGEGGAILGRRSVFKAGRWDGPVPDARRGYIGSIAHQLCAVAAGTWDAALATNRLHEWDVAAGALILAEAGGLISDQRGAALAFNRPAPRIDGMIAARPGLHGDLAARLIPKV